VRPTTSSNSGSRNFIARLAATAAGAATISLAGLSPAALAFPFPPSPREVHEKILHDLRDAIELPRHILSEQREMFRSFTSERNYYAPHHHYHMIYSLPVYIDGTVVYRPYSYCNDELFMAGTVPLPPLMFGFDAQTPYPVYRSYRAPYYPQPRAFSHFRRDNDYEDHGYRHEYEHDRGDDHGRSYRHDRGRGHDGERGHDDGHGRGRGRQIEHGHGHGHEDGRGSHHDR
jgi:hypothetical protein